MHLIHVQCKTAAKLLCASCAIFMHPGLLSDRTCAKCSLPGTNALATNNNKRSDNNGSSTESADKPNTKMLAHLTCFNCNTQLNSIYILYEIHVFGRPWGQTLHTQIRIPLI